MKTIVYYVWRVGILSKNGWQWSSDYETFAALSAACGMWFDKHPNAQIRVIKERRLKSIEDA